MANHLIMTNKLTSQSVAGFGFVAKTAQNDLLSTLVKKTLAKLSKLSHQVVLLYIENGLVGSCLMLLVTFHFFVLDNTTGLICDIKCLMSW